MFFQHDFGIHNSPLLISNDLEKNGFQFVFRIIMGNKEAGELRFQILRRGKDGTWNSGLHDDNKSEE